jgi:hypothetical protein
MAQTFNKPIVEATFLGLDDSNPPEKIGRGYFQKVENAYLSDEKISKVTGSSMIGSAIATQVINGFASFEKLSTSSKWLVVNINGASNAQLYVWTGSGNFTAIGLANLTNSKTMYFESAAEYLLGFNGTEVVDYDGTNVTRNRATVPIGYFPKWFHNYLFVAKTDSYLNRLFWSDLGDPTTFTVANYIDVNPGDSDQCMGLGTLGDELFFFKQSSIWAITGFAGTTFSSTTIAGQNINARLQGYGCVAPNSILTVGNDIYFFSFLGSMPVIRSLRATQYATTLAGGIISNLIDGTMATINLSQLGKIVSCYDGRYAMWSVPTSSSSTNNLILVLDTWETTKKSGKSVYKWTTMKGKNAGFFAVSTIPGYGKVYFTDALTTGKVFKFDTSVYTDNGTAITMDVRSRSFMLDPARKSKWKYMYVAYETGSSALLEVKARIDRAITFTAQKNIPLAGTSPGLGPTGTFTLGTSTLGGQQTDEDRVTFMRLTGHLLGVQFLEETANSCVLHHFEIYGKAKGLRAS